MGDTGEEDERIILNAIATLYCDLVVEIGREIDGQKTDNKILELKKRIQNQEELLYGKQEPRTYQQKVVDLYNQYEQLVFYLAKNSNESIASIKRMTIGERCKFQVLLQESMRRKPEPQK